MNKTEYEQINETLYHEVLPNGLTVYLLPKMTITRHMVCSVRIMVRSITNLFPMVKRKGESSRWNCPFLEHKLFEKEDGDVFQLFGKQGASANAFTSFTKTSYLFSTTDQVEKNLTTLIDFVQAPYFTEETVNKEKGIIGQEIQMYEDDPNWRMFLAY